MRKSKTLNDPVQLLGSDRKRLPGTNSFTRETGIHRATCLTRCVAPLGESIVSICGLMKHAVFLPIVAWAGGFRTPVTR
jgi:hypothetical protein